MCIVVVALAVTAAPIVLHKLVRDVSSHPSRNNDIWISSRREEDLVDFKDIEQFFTFKKQRDAALAEVEYLKKQIQNQQPASECQGGTSQTVSIEWKTVKDENENVPVSTKKFCKPFNTKNETRSEFGTDCGKKMEKKKQQPANFSLRPLR